MTEHIRIIFYNNFKLLGVLDKTVYYFREQQYEKALNRLADSIDQAKLVLEEIINNREYFNLVTTEALLEMLTRILEAKKNKDFILLADLLELQLISFLVGVQELIINKINNQEIIFKEENYKASIERLQERGVGFTEELLEPINTEELIEQGYGIEFTSCGQMTLSAENEGLKFYFHTNHKIIKEAFLLARNWVQNNKKCYLIYGFGMGYHIRELLELAEEAEIVVYEADLNVLKLACAFADVKELLSSKQLTVIYDPYLELWRKRTSQLEPEDTFIHYPSFLNMRNTEGKEILKKSFPWLHTVEAC